uniref:furin n=1 Tax=Panstrongylus lignarius TaxID=156445 RepID=A0A224XK28_9HEMI
MVSGEMVGVWTVLLLAVEVCSHYTSQWAAHIEGGYTVANDIAQTHGFTILAEIFPDTYHLEHRKVAKRSLKPNTQYHDNLISEKQVKWAKQQRARRRKKRDYLMRKDLGLSDSHVYLNDQRWPQMWYLNRGSGLDMSVEGAWKEGVTGKGIVVTILDDGLEKDHPDLKENYDPQASFDVNSHDDNPMPRYDMIDSNRHGTRCAGEVAAVANNTICSVGIAYKASVGGVRMLDGDVTDAVEARSLSFSPQHIDIYSASWGPDDDGKTVDGPGELAMRAFIEGVTKGRSGKGSIFVWASGNGGRDHDNCNCDGYTNSIWTLSISSATENGLVPWYSEACSSTLATTYSSGSTGEKQIVTTDLHHQCTSTHTGTSASAPLAAGICALALEANTQLTWRDMQHIVVATAKPANLRAPDWTTNGVGRNVSHSFGYGLMDAAAMVKLARSWPAVPQQHKCEVSAPHIDKVIPAKSYVTLQLNVKECAGVNYLEHVQAKISLMSQRRGDIEIQLTSPAGTKTTLLARRPHDISRSGFRSWPFMSVHTWGENPIGTWMLDIHNEARFLAQLSDWNLIFYGTEIAPGQDPEGLSSGKKKGDVLTSPVSGPVDNNVETSRGIVGSGSDSGGDSSPPGWPDLAQRTSSQQGLEGLGIGHGDMDLVPISSTACRVTSRACLECSPGYYLWQGHCEVKCPSGTYATNSVCTPCHYTCEHCTGTNDYECTQCYPDAEFYNVSSFESYCYPKSILPWLNYTKWYYITCIGLAINGILLVLGGILFYLRRGCTFTKKKNNLQPTVINSVKYRLTNNDSDSDN